MCIHRIRKAHPVTEYRLQNRRQCARRATYPHAGLGVCQAGDRTNHTAFGLLYCLVFIACIDADLIDLFLPAAVLVTS